MKSDSACSGRSVINFSSAGNVHLITASGLIRPGFLLKDIGDMNEGIVRN
ncbi:MAG: hypothetical protein M2R45_05114 [Verrucomicrobia subdivision 3 bacterium]|nr:hypothetical protein [Limisphaerales bacterium]MCS1417176.1 hypothetical protein [Limisphaerales bacterium]